MAYGTEIDPAGRRDRRPGQRRTSRVAKREVAGEGRVGVPSAFAGPSEVVVDRRRRRPPPTSPPSTSSCRPSTAPAAWPGSSPGTRRWPTRSSTEIDRAGRGVAPAGRHRVDLRRGRLRGRWSTGPSRRSRWPTSSPPSTSSCCAPTRRRWCRGSATPARCSAGRGRRRRSATTSPGPSHVLPTDGSARFGSALTVSRLHQARPRRHARPRGRCSRSAPHVEALADRRGPRRPRRLDPPPPERAVVSATHAVRARRRATTSRSWRATTRPRSTWTVRLNTNESPDAAAGRVPRARWPTSWPASTGTATPTAPPPSCAPPSARCTASGPSRSSRPTAPTRCCRRCCSPTAAPGRSVAVFEPTYALHGHIARITGTDGGRRRAHRRLRARPRRGAPRARPSRPGHHVPVLAQQPDRHGRAARRRCAAVLDAGAGPGRGRRGLRAVRAVVGARAGRRRRAARRHPHVLQDVVDGRRPPRLPRRPGVGRRRAREGRAAVPPRRGQAGRRARSRCASPTRWRRGSAELVEERGRLSAALGDLAVDVWPSGANFVLFRPAAARRRRRCGRRCVDRSVLVRNCSSWPRLDGCLRVTIGTRAEDDALPRRARGGPRHDAAPRPRERDDQGDVDRHRRSTSTGRPARSRRPPACRSSTTCSTSSAATAASTSTVEADGRPRTSTATTPSRTSASCSARPSREALGDKAGVRRFASGLFPLDEALVEVALDLSGRPFVVYDVPFGEVLPLGDPPFNPRDGRALLAVVRHRRRHHAARHARRPGATPTTSSRPRSRAWPAACATRCGSRATGVPSTKGTL